MRFREAIAALSLSAFISSPAFSQQPTAHQSSVRPRAEVLVLGVYHMSNPGHDIFSTEADDVPSRKRQAEIAEVVATLRSSVPRRSPAGRFQ